MKTEHICQTCKHFRQHYVKWDEDHFLECGSGHCVYPRRKPRRNGAKACQHYTPKAET